MTPQLLAIHTESLIKAIQNESQLCFVRTKFDTKHFANHAEYMLKFSISFLKITN